MDNVDHFYAKTRQEWHNWLDNNHAVVKSVWLVFDKGKNSDLTYGDIVEEALCYGWVDSRPGKVDDTKTKLYISQRKPKSAWSKSNKARIKKLMGSNSMREPGLKAVEIAKQNGAWDTLNLSDKLAIPKQMQDLLALHPTARDNYEKFSPSSKRIILEWIYSAKQEATRQRRIEQTVELAEKGIKANHYGQ